VLALGEAHAPEVAECSDGLVTAGPGDPVEEQPAAVAVLMAAVRDLDADRGVVSLFKVVSSFSKIVSSGKTLDVFHFF
jgi:hypothetical protein